MMKTKGFLIILFLACFGSGFSQYLANPSFEGIPLMIGPPPDWSVCLSNSTPNVQPGKYSVFLPPSDGITYIGLLTRDVNTWEDMEAVLDVPLSKDTCYWFKIDLAYQNWLSFTTVDPVVLKVYGSSGSCQKDNLLWQSPPVSNEDWVTSEFLIHNEEFDITHLALEAYYAAAFPYWGYILLDNIRITPAPLIDLGSDTTLILCESDSLVLDPGSGYANYLWQDGSTNSTFVVDTSGLYWVEVTTDYGCSATDSINITIEEYEAMVSESIDSTMVCEGQEVTLTVNVQNGVEPYSYSWLNLPDTTPAIVVIADSSRYYYVTISDHCGYSILDSIKIVVVASPEIDLGNDTLVCPDGSFELNAGQGYIQYLWQDGSSDSSITVTQPGIYWVEVTSIFGCVARDSINIDLFPAISLDLGNDTVLCVGDSVNFNAGNGFIDYLWQDNSTDTSYTAYNSGIYWVFVTDIYGCHTSDTVVASFLSQPEVDLGNDFSICEGEEQLLDAGIGFLSYQWQDNDTSQFYLVTEAGWYWVSVDNGCGEAIDSVYVEVLPSPQPNLGPDTTLCDGASLMLDPGNQYISYLWQDNSDLPYYSVNSAGIYTVNVENNFGCFGEDEIVVNYSNSEINLGTDQQLCEGDSLVLNAGEGFVSYLWQDNSTQQSCLVNSSGTYTVMAIDEFGCEITDEVSFSYYPYPNPDLGPNQTICEGESTILHAPEGAFDYYWNGIPGASTQTISASGKYTLSVVNPCDSVSDEIQVMVEAIPEVYLGEDNVLFSGQTITLDAGSGFDQYVWQDGSGGQYFVLTENNIEPSNPYYYVEVSEGSCKNSDTIRIELFHIWVPNVITLNSDGLNDVFKADPEKWSGINQHHMQVFNRWGEKVWESDDFLSGWDGRRNGSYVADGTYYWILDVFAGPQNLKQTFKGTLSVLDSTN